MFENSVVVTIGSGGPWYGTGEAAETPQEMSGHCLRDVGGGGGADLHGRPSIGVEIVL